MELSPQAVATASFDTVRKGFDPEEVRTYLARVAAQLGAAQQQAAAMEARARAAIAKMQEMQQAAPAEPTPNGIPAVPTDEAETISRTLVLAQRTADATVAEAKAQADELTSSAHAEATSALAQAKSEAIALVEQARAEARHAKEDELAKADGEVQALLARRDFLLGDVEILEEHVGAQRDRIRDAVSVLQDLIERVPAGLGEMRLPLLSASADDTLESIGADATADLDTTPAGVVRIGAEERR